MTSTITKYTLLVFVERQRVLLSKDQPDVSRNDFGKLYRTVIHSRFEFPIVITGGKLLPVSSRGGGGVNTKLLGNTSETGI